MCFKNDSCVEIGSSGCSGKGVLIVDSIELLQKALEKVYKSSQNIKEKAFLLLKNEKTVKKQYL